MRHTSQPEWLGQKAALFQITCFHLDRVSPKCLLYNTVTTTPSKRAAKLIVLSTCLSILSTHKRTDKHTHASTHSCTHQRLDFLMLKCLTNSNTCVFGSIFLSSFLTASCTADGGTVSEEDQACPGPQLGMDRQVSYSKTEASPHRSSCIPPPALWHVTQINSQ